MADPMSDIPLDLDVPPPRKPSIGGQPKKKEVAPVRKLPVLTEDIFAGISPGPQGDCCNDCSTDLCMITMIGFCGHPNKGALQSTLQNKPEIVARRRFAKRMLDTMMLEARKE